MIARTSEIDPEAAEKIYATKDGAVGWIVFNQPEKRNAMSQEMWLALPDLISRHEADGDVRVIMLRGSGDRAFISGADISQFEKLRSDMEKSKAYNHATEAAMLAVQESAKPTVAMIYGFCFGGGMGIATACDLRIAADNAKFRIPAARLGLSYGFAGIGTLIGIVGAANAREIFITANVYGADEMLRMGYLNRVFPEDQLESQAGQYAATIAKNAPLTLQSIKISINQATLDPEARDMERVEAAAARCFNSNDYQEGRKAFMEKREPEFSGT